MWFMTLMLVLSILFFLGALLVFIVKIVRAVSSMPTNEKPDFNMWKFYNGIWGYQTPEMDEKLRKMYDAERYGEDD
jgi:hypothetical protein